MHNKLCWLIILLVFHKFTLTYNFEGVDLMRIWRVVWREVFSLNPV